MLRPTAEIIAFRSSKVLVESLKEELKLPGISAALKALDTLARPRGIPEVQPGVPHDTTIAHDFCQLAGVTATLRMLGSMTFAIEEKSPLDQEMAEEEPFMHAIPESLRKPN